MKEERVCVREREMEKETEKEKEKEAKIKQTQPPRQHNGASTRQNSCRASRPNAQEHARVVSLRNNEYFYSIPPLNSPSVPALSDILIVSRAKIDRSQQIFPRENFRPARERLPFSSSLPLSLFAPCFFNFNFNPMLA